MAGLCACVSALPASAAAPFVLRTRKFMAGPYTFMVGAGGEYPTISALYYDLQQNWDLNGQNAVCMLMDGQQHAPATLYGPLPGMQGPHSFVIRSSDFGRSSIVANRGGACLELAYGAQASLMYVTLDGATRAPCNDLLMLGQGAKMTITQPCRLIQNSSYNWISMYGGPTLEIYANLFVQGQGQCFITADGGSQAMWMTDSHPNSIAMYFEAGVGRDRPYWQHSFLNPRGGTVITHQLVDYHGAEPAAYGYRYKVDKGGILDVYLEFWGGGQVGLDRMPGSANTFGGVQGFIF